MNYALLIPRMGILHWTRFWPIKRKEIYATICFISQVKLFFAGNFNIFRNLLKNKRIQQKTHLGHIRNKRMSFCQVLEVPVSSRGI